jgi:hypothetical protein
MNDRKQKISVLLVALVCSCGWGYGQYSMKGFVLDENNSQPISFATVYIHGTTNAVQTDDRGFFVLKNVSAPFQLAISHLGYKIINQRIDQIGMDTTTFLMSEKDVPLSEAVIQAKGINNRNKYLQEFLDEFLGADEWGKHTQLRNDSDLVFKVYSDTNRINANFKYIHVNGSGSFYEQFLRWCESRKSDSVSSVISVSAEVPLTIDLPLLGYSVVVQLENFTLKKRGGKTYQTAYDACFYFKPNKARSKKELEEVRKNRVSAYYNSNMHFFRALYHDSLKANGYVTSQLVYDQVAKRNKQQFLNLSALGRKQTTGPLIFNGLKGVTFFINYFESPFHKPLNLVEIDLRNKKSYSELGLWFKYIELATLVRSSTITFLEDCCTIRADGTIPKEGPIKITGEMALKGVGAKLPSDYYPEMQ